MILIEENFNGVLTEATADGKKTYLKGVFAEAEVKNQNGRVYDLKEMTREAEKAQSMADQGNHMLGECDHPHTLEIKLQNVSHKIVECYMQGNQMIAKAEVLEKTPSGAILKALIDSGIKPGVSTRASGAVMESTGRVAGFKLVTVDAVATPSCRNAVPMTLREHIEMYGRGHIVTDLSEAVVNDPAAQKYFLEEMRKFVSSVLKK